MSTIYPNFQNKNYFNYLQYVKSNDIYFDKIKYSKPKIDDKCPETMIYSNQSGKLHKYFKFLGKEFNVKKFYKQNKNILYKII
jgi:hypothetical protein